MSKLKYFIFIAIFVLISLKYGSEARRVFTDNTNSFLATFLNAKQNIKDKIDEHFFQAAEIKRLKKENSVLKKSSELSIAFAQKLNQFLKLENMDKYAPKLELVSSLAYANLNDYYKVWIDFKDFNKSKIYGLVYNGNAAGIVVAEDGNPLGLLLGDPKSIFSVSVGKEQIPGVVYGKKKELYVKFIPLWMHPKIGDEVITSGKDGVFFKGIRVGVVTRVIKEELSQTAVVKPYIDLKVPSYYYVIKEL
jgi:rod shape-determining protein MreC